MISLKILDIKQLMKKLLLDTEDAFDDFLLSKAVVKMAVTFSIDGHLNEEFFDNNNSSEEFADMNRPMTYWKDVKSNIFSVIKGKKVPAGFSIVLYKNSANADLMLRILYDGSELTALTGSVHKEFTLDKSDDMTWDEEIKNLFTDCEIPFELQ